MTSKPAAPATAPCPKCSVPIIQTPETEFQNINCPSCGYEFQMPGDMSNLGAMDRQFISASGCGLVGLAVLFNGPAFLLGVVGLLTCKHPFARKRALDLTLVGGFITLLGIAALVALAYFGP